MTVTDVDYPSTLLASYIFTMLSQCVGLYRDRLFAEGLVESGKLKKIEKINIRNQYNNNNDNH